MYMRKSILLFALVPVIFLITVCTYIIYAGISYPAGADPEYNYLFNGITLAHLKFHLSSVGHPGTPIQCLIAVSARVVHLFRPGSLWDDVMLNPELYIKAPIYAANFINAVVLFLLGWRVYRYTNSLVVALALQLTPFAFLMTVEVNYRLMPELIMVSIVSVWIIVIVRLLYENPVNIDYKKYSTVLAILYGFSLADKLTFLPFFILPFFILPDWKLRLRFVIISVFAFFIFAFPVLNNFHKFTSWVTDIFIHKGAYGSGDPGIIDVPYFINNIKIIIKSSRQLWIPLLIAFILSLVLFRNNKDILSRVALGLFLSVLVHFIITAKHYAFYYLVPSLLMAIFGVYLIYLILNRRFPGEVRRRVLETLFVLTILFIILNTVKKMNGQLAGLFDRKKMHNEALETFKPYLSNNKPKLIVPNYYGCSAIEYSLLFGLLESGKHGSELTAEFKKHYPSSLIYLYWGDAFYDGIFQVSPNEFLKPDIEYTLFVADHSPQMIGSIVQVLSDTTGFVPEIELLKEYSPKSEAVYTLKLTR